MCFEIMLKIKDETNIYIYIYRVEFNIISPNNLLLNLYFENLTIELYILYVFNMHANFYINQVLFTIQFINSYFMQYFKLQKLEFK